MMKGLSGKEIQWLEAFTKFFFLINTFDAESAIQRLKTSLTKRRDGTFNTELICQG
jgi:hypothetical protein